MAIRIDTPTATVRQVSGKDGDGRFILSVLVKETYRIRRDGRMQREETTPLHEDPIADPENSYLLAEDSDLFPFKLATDFVVKGHAYNPVPSSARPFEARIRVGANEKRLLVVGDRECRRSSTTGKARISDPKPVDRVPLSYAFAYGGRDAVAEAKHGNVWEQFEQFMLPNPPDLSGASPYLYPRNLAGVGFVIEPTAEALEAVRLPNLEDPIDRLSEDRLVVGSVHGWPSMPMPQATGWVDHGWFPRIAYAGMAPDVPHDTPVQEVARGYAPTEVVEDLENRAMPDAFYLRFANGASLGLQVPYLRGGEEVALTNMSRSPEVAIRLPETRPGISVDARKGQLRETEPVMHTVVFEPDQARVTIVWRGSAPALRPYTPDELAKMPLRVELR